MIDLIISRLNQEQLYYDDEWITDGSVTIKRELAVDIEPYLKNAQKKEDGKISALIKEKKKFLTEFSLNKIYKDAEYILNGNYTLLPVDKDKGWYVDSRWLSKVYEFFDDIEEIKVYEIQTNKRDGFILEVLGYANNIVYHTCEEPK